MTPLKDQIYKNEDKELSASDLTLQKPPQILGKIKAKAEVIKPLNVAESVMSEKEITNLALEEIQQQYQIAGEEEFEENDEPSSVV